MRGILAGAAMLAATGAGADTLRERFVAHNILGIFYHELGHALIDRRQIPIFGQEEDAADVLSAIMIDAFFDNDLAVEIGTGTALTFLSDAEKLREAGEEPYYAAVHGLDEQRYYNLVCLIYGADPDLRSELPEELGLPEDRAETCPDEFDLANASWGAVLDEMEEGAPGDSFRVVRDPDAGAGADLLEAVLTEEAAAMNADFVLEAPLIIRIAYCGEANAFYDLDTTEITMCTEFVPYLEEARDRMLD